VAIFRQKLGEKLYRQCGFRPGALASVPDSGNQSFIGYVGASGCEPQILLVKDSQIPRTFISPRQQNRAAKARLKYNPISFVIEMYKSIMIIDDSIVRATTIREIIRMIRKVVKNSIKIHIGSVSPPIKHPCYYGIDFPTHKELVAANRTQEEVRRAVGADGLYYLSYEGLIEVMEEMNLNPDNYCKACFNGEYSIPLH
jgi:amidophosphoribosyltransferase